MGAARWGSTVGGEGSPAGAGKRWESPRQTEEAHLISRATATRHVHVRKGYSGAWVGNEFLAQRRGDPNRQLTAFTLLLSNTLKYSR